MNRNHKILFLFMMVSLFFACNNHTIRTDYLELIKQGKFSKAETVINELKKDATLPPEEVNELAFEIERMNRIRKDFTLTNSEVVEYVRKYIPEATDADFERWENEKSLEVKKIDGKKLYFKYAARNLFRINEECRKIWHEYLKDEKETPPVKNALDLDVHNQSIINEAKKSGKFVKPVKMRINYSISVKPDIVPKDETIRCWIPFPREIENRQTDIKILKTYPEVYQLADNTALQRTIYFEQASDGEERTRFNVEYEYTSYGTHVAIDPQKVKQVDLDGPLSEYLKQEPPHILFTNELKELSIQIVGNETNPYRIAQLLFKWVDDNVPWASAREYSTIRSLSKYPYNNRHGDCGIQTMIFMTLCRLNNIPTRWQSGWEFQPPKDSMHDWGMIYFEPYGWVPMDVTYGVRNSEVEELKWFYLSGMDSYRLIFNDDYSQPFDPPKKHFRSETIDSQRGEVEWKGGNLYFDQWNWDMNWEVVSK